MVDNPRARGAECQATARRDPPSVRLARHRPDGAGQPGRVGARASACRGVRANAGARSRGCGCWCRWRNGVVSADNAGEHQAFLCRQSGRVYWYVEHSNDELSELPEDIDDSEKYVQIPDKRELDLGKALVLEFVRQTLPSEIDKVQRIFSAKGAYATFKDLMDRKGALDQWYNFEAKAEEEALRTWCALNSIEISD
jgi:hypothetical protein